ncbi:hypothetical protein OAL67_00020 [bacterium]|nr:hypothetical protein [bacterium]
MNTNKPEGVQPPEKGEVSPNMQGLMAGEFGPAPKKVVTWGHGTWNEVTSIGTSDNHLFENTCGVGDEVDVEPGDAVFGLCSSDGWRGELAEKGMDSDGSVYKGQANQCFYLVTEAGSEE